MSPMSPLHFRLRLLALELCLIGALFTLYLTGQLLLLGLTWLVVTFGDVGGEAHLLYSLAVVLWTGLCALQILALK